MTDLFSGFIFASLGASMVILFLLLLKHGVRHHLSPCWQYRIDLLMMLTLVVPLLPGNLLNFADLDNWPIHQRSVPLVPSENMGEQFHAATTANNFDWMQDMAVSVTQFMTDRYFTVLAILWLLGLAAFGIRLFFCSRELRLVKESVRPTEDKLLLQLFFQAKAELRIKRKIDLGLSIMVKSPMIIGFLNPLIILPHDVTEQFQPEEIYHVLLHELFHCKRQDIFFNHFLCLLQMVYWFNPLVYFACKRIRLDRETACDFSVLACLPEEHHLLYGKTMLNFVGRLSRQHSSALAMEMGGTKGQLSHRMQQIASYQLESKKQRIKNGIIFGLTLLLVLSQIPAVSALSGATNHQNHYGFSASNVMYEDLSSYFGDDEGCFVLYDLTDGQYTIYNEEISTRRMAPASTYKIYSALIALEEGIITSENSTLAWDGTTYSFAAWNQDQDLMSAMQNSVSWYFQDLDQQVGKEKLSFWFEQLAYGNQHLSGRSETDWAGSILRISPIEQVELLTAFYQNNTLFQQEYVDIVKNVLQLSMEDGATLSGKTGSVAVNGKMVNGWFIGYVEKDSSPSVFALYLEGKDNAGGNTAAKVALSILTDKGLYSSSKNGR